MSDSRFVQVLQNLIQEEIIEGEEHLSIGTAVDFADYKARCAKLAAYRNVLENLIPESQKKAAN